MELLPPEEKKILQKKQLLRFGMAISFGFSAVFLMGAVLLLPAYFSLKFQEKELGRLLAVTKESFKRSDVSQIEKKLKEFEAKTEKFLQNEKEVNAPSLLFGPIISAQPAGIKLNSLVYTSKILLTGEALSRDDFLKFLGRLNSSGLFSEIDSPISNLLKSENLKFSLTLKLKQ